jgi:hypothetical protein
MFPRNEPKFETHSERVLWNICKDCGYEIQTLPSREKINLRTADFRINHAGITMIAEVEEIRANQDDLRQIREMKEKHFTTGGGIIGARARHHIRDAADQLKAHASERVPLVVFLYNSIRKSTGGGFWPMANLESYHIDAAMYGNMVVHVALTPGAACRPDRNGGKRTLTATEKTYISAVAVISDNDDRTVIFYHNCFAAVPLPKDFFVGPHFFHLEKPKEPFDSPCQWQSRE